MMIPMRFGWSRSIPNLSTSALVLAGMATATVPGCNSSGSADVHLRLETIAGEVQIDVNIEWGEPQSNLPLGSVFIGTAEVHGRRVDVFRDPEGSLWISSKGSQRYSKVTKGLEDIQERLTPLPLPPSGGGRPELVPDGEVPPLPGGPLAEPDNPLAPADDHQSALIETLRGVLMELDPTEQVVLANHWAGAVPGLVSDLRFPRGLPASNDVVVVIDDASLSADEAADTAMLWFTLPNNAIDVVDPATTPFEVQFSRIDHPDGRISITYAGTINNVLGAAMHQGVSEITLSHPVAGNIVMKIESETSSVASTVNGIPAPAPYDLRLIWTSETGGSE